MGVGDEERGKGRRWGLFSAMCLYGASLPRIEGPIICLIRSNYLPNWFLYSDV